MWEMAMIRNASAVGDGDQLSLLSYIFVDHPFIVCPIHPNFAHITTSLWVCVENFCTLNVINSKSSPYFNLYHTHTHMSTIFFLLIVGESDCSVRSSNLSYQTIMAKSLWLCLDRNLITSNVILLDIYYEYLKI